MEVRRLSTKQISYFWSLVKKTSGCWLWRGQHDNIGRGIIKFWKSPQKASRVSWLINKGEWPKLFVLHKCDNYNCVNPDHLFSGTQLDNMKDMIKKGRKIVRRGSKRSDAKLDELKVSRIKQLLSTGAVTQKQIAGIFGVSRSTILGIHIGKTWKHVI